MTQKKQVRVYCAGGAGCNIGRQLEQHRGVEEKAFGLLDMCYLDTSRSNLDDGLPEGSIYLIDGLDGSGKIRSENHVEINKHVRNILQQYRPGDLNIVMGSLAGGSGSVFAPLLTQALLKEGATTIVIGIGSSDTRLDAENTMKTLKSYEAIAQAAEHPVVMVYRQNGAVARKTVDEDIKAAIISLSALFSGENRELDSKDLAHWLNFSRSTQNKTPHLVTLHTIDNTEKGIGPDYGNIISVATLARDGDVTKLDPEPEFQCVGFIPAATVPYIAERAPLHYLICDGVIPTVVKELNATIKAIDDRRNARVGAANILTQNDVVDSSGLVL